MVEDLLSIITRHTNRRGSFTSVKDPVATIESFIDRIDRPAGAEPRQCREGRQGDRPRCYQPAAFQPPGSAKVSPTMQIPKNEVDSAINPKPGDN
jgi:hypothetical protein